MILGIRPITTIFGEPEVVRSVLRTASAKLAQANETTLARWLLSMAEEDVVGDGVVKVHDKDTTR